MIRLLDGWKCSVVNGHTIKLGLRITILCAVFGAILVATLAFAELSDIIVARVPIGDSGYYDLQSQTFPLILNGIDNERRLVGWAQKNIGIIAYEDRVESFTFPGFQIPNDAILPTGINDAGYVVGRYWVNFVNPRGFLRKPDGEWISIDCAGATYTIPYDINNKGQIVGTVVAPQLPSLPGTTRQYGFFRNSWTEPCVEIVYPGVLPNGLPFPTEARSINDETQIVGFYATYTDTTGQTNHGFIFNGQQYRTIDAPGFAANELFGINNQSQVVGGSLEEGRGYTFDLTTNAFSEIKVPGAGYTVPNGINDAGDILGEWNPPGGANLRKFLKLSSDLRAPTNLHAKQLGTSGTQIRLTWDYTSTDLIDGFEIERQTPLERQTDTWQLLPAQPTPAARAYTDSVSPFNTYSYRLRVYKGTNKSGSSNEVTCFQLKLFTEANNIRMVAVFQPGVPASLAENAAAFGFDHFNWISSITYAPIEVTSGPYWRDWNGNHVSPPPVTDPARNGWYYRQADSLPYYWDEQSGFDILYSLFAHTLQPSLDFRDAPGLALPTDPDIPPYGGNYYQFFTELVGVKNPVGSSLPPQYTPLAHFTWRSNHTERLGGGISDFRTSNLDPPIESGPGGIFNVEIISSEDLPRDLRMFLIQSGAQDLSTAPKVDKDAPTTLAILSGTQGTNGWYTGPVTVRLIATDIDGPSDIADTSYSVDGSSVTNYTVPFTVSSDGTHTIVFGSVDRALNAEMPRPSQAFRIDRTPPAVTITRPANSATYTANQVVNAAYTCVDGGSGPATCIGTVPTGGKIDTTPAGISTTKTFTVNATDTAGNPTSQSASYVVSCHYVALGVSPSTVARGGKITVTGNVNSCTNSAQVVSIKFTLTSPQGRGSCAATNTVMFQTPPFTIPAGTSKTVSFPFQIPKNTCPGTYTATSTTLVNGVAIDNTSTTLIVQ